MTKPALPNHTPILKEKRRPTLADRTRRLLKQRDELKALRDEQRCEQRERDGKSSD